MADAPPTTISATREFRAAWRAFQARPGVFVVSMLVLFVSWAALEVSVITLHPLGVVVSALFHLAFLWLFCGLVVGLHVMALEAAAGGAPPLGLLAGSLDRGWSCLFASCLYLLATSVGLALLVVPGVFVAVRYAFFGQVLATQQANAWTALRGSAEISRGHWWATCRFALLALALNLAGAALMGVGLLISVPVSLLASARFFRTLQGS